MSAFFTYFAAISVNLMSLLSGISYAWSSSMLPILKELKGSNPLPEKINLHEESLITSLLNLGAALGPFLSGFSSQKIGRKKTLITFNIPMLISNLFLIFAQSVMMFYVSRFLAGLCIGCVFTVVPIFLAEISENSNRGLISSTLMLMMIFGTVSTYFISPYVSISLLGIISVIPSVLFFTLFCFFIPETPHFLVMQGKDEEAKKCLAKYRGSTIKNLEVQQEFNGISDRIKFAQKETGSIKDMFKSKAAIKALIIANGLFTFQQCSGIIAILSYMQDIFQRSGSSFSPEVSVMLVGVVQIVSVILSGQLIDKTGRRSLLLSSMLGNCIALSILATYFLLDNHNYNLGSFFWLPVTSLMLFIFSFSLGCGPISWIIAAEIFPENVRAIATTLSSTYALTLAFLFAQFFQYLVTFFGISNIFFMFALASFSGFIFVSFYVPETKGKSYHEIQDLLS